MSRLAFLAAGIIFSATAAHAGIVNLSASSNSPNAGPNSGTYSYNPVQVALAAGSYTVSVVGIAGGGLYDAYSVYSPTATNGAYTDSSWSVSPATGNISTAANIGRYNTAAAALTAYSALAPIYFTLSTAQTVSFYVDDSASPYFADDAGGVSLAVTNVPEPASLTLFGGGLTALAWMRRRRQAR